MYAASLHLDTLSNRWTKIKLRAQLQLADFLSIPILRFMGTQQLVLGKLYVVSVYASPQDFPMPAPILAMAAVSSPVAMTGCNASCHFVGTSEIITFIGIIFAVDEFGIYFKVQWPASM